MYVKFLLYSYFVFEGECPGESTTDRLPWCGDSEGEGRGFTAPAGGGHTPRVSESPIS